MGQKYALRRLVPFNMKYLPITAPFSRRLMLLITCNRIKCLHSYQDKKKKKKKRGGGKKKGKEEKNT